MTQLALFAPPVLAEQLALDIEHRTSNIESTVFRSSDEGTKPITHQQERPTMPTPTEPVFTFRPLRWSREWRDRRRGRARTRAAQRRRATDVDASLVFAELTSLDLRTIRYALEDRERIHQGTPAGEAAHVTRSKLG